MNLTAQTRVCVHEMLTKIVKYLMNLYNQLLDLNSEVNKKRDHHMLTHGHRDVPDLPY